MLLLYVSDEKSHLLSLLLTGKSVEQTVELLEIYNQSCVLEGILINDQ